MKSFLFGLAASFALVFCLSGLSANADTITQWNFDTVTAAPDNNPAPSIGSGIATPLGMDNGYTFSTGPNIITGSGTFTPGGTVTTGSTTSCDITLNGSTPAPSGLPNAWRVRGANTGNGWALQAPQYTQGAEFTASTAGYSDIGFHFDWYSTAQGVKNLQEQYTLDGSSWININAPLTANSKGFLSSTQNIDFSGIPAAANNPNFGVRLVSVYDNTLSPLNYGSADGKQSGVYNNNSGNWRFTNVGFSGTPAAVPEPSTFALLAVGAIGLLGYARRKRNG